MKKYNALPLAAVAGGAVAFVLRLLQNRTGFEAETGLAIPGNLFGIALVILLVILAAVVLVLARPWPGKGEAAPVFPADFSVEDPKQLMLPVAGAFLMALAGLADVFEGLTSGNLLAQMRAAADPYGLVAVEPGLFSSRVQLILGVLLLLTGAALVLSVVACRRKEGAQGGGYNPTLLLVAPVVLVVRLVLTYRADSVNPSLAAYYVSLLALIFLTLAFYRLSSFAYECGDSRGFARYAGIAVVLSLASLADGGPHMSSLLLYAGSAVFLLGFLLRMPCSESAG